MLFHFLLKLSEKRFSLMFLTRLQFQMDMKGTVFSTITLYTRTNMFFIKMVKTPLVLSVIKSGGLQNRLQFTMKCCRHVRSTQWRHLPVTTYRFPLYPKTKSTFPGLTVSCGHSCRDIKPLSLFTKTKKPGTCRSI